MTAHISLSLGRRPWQPAPGIRMVLELAHWDMPTEGILKQRFRNRYFLFRCIAGATGTYNLWAYVPLASVEARSLKALAGPNLASYVDEVMRSRPFMIALAEDDRGIVHASEGRIDAKSGKPMISPAAVKTAQREYAQEAGAIRNLLATC